MRVRVTLGLVGSFALAAVAGFAVAMNAITEAFHSARLGLVLVVLLLFHLLRFPRFVLNRESVLYGAFVGYMLVALLWTANVRLAMNTLVPALDFLLILILFGALLAFHDVRTVLAGTLCGFFVVAATYTVTTGFPFVWPKEFVAYNAIAGMYLFGLFLTLTVGWYARSLFLTMAVAFILVAHIVASTSFKTSLGIIIGTIGAMLISGRAFAGLLRRHAISLVAIIAAITYVVASGGDFVNRFEAGVERVMLGVKLLETREDQPGFTGIEVREAWARAGLRGWTSSPLLGHGVEAFRDRYATTSHAVPVELLYNFGVIGLLLFYGIFASMAWRVLRLSDAGLVGLRALLFGTLLAYLFVTFSGTVYYNAFLAVFVAICTALAGRHRRKVLRSWNPLPEGRL